MSDTSINSGNARVKFYYGWVIVAVCVIMIAITYGLLYSYSVFFKPIAAHFNWNRETVSAVYSVSLILRGAASIGVGWLADRYGSVKLSVFCALMIGVGLFLASRVSELWQLFVSYGLIEAVGLSGAFGICMAATSRWFTRNRGLVLGIVSSGTGLGTLILVPASERLISSYGWSMTFVILGTGAWLIMTACAFFLKPYPKEKQPIANAGNAYVLPAARQLDMTLSKAVRSKKMILMMTVFFLMVFCLQLIMVHLVNYATDMGISPLAAASFISIIGAVSIAGRLLMGRASDKIGIVNSLMLCCIMLTASLIWLLFVRAPWGFYLFAVIFGFAYGGEVPQIPMYIGHYFGTRAMAALVGLTLFVSNIGGALGPWVGGRIFDTTQDYHIAFVAAVGVGVCTVAVCSLLKKYS